METEHTVVTIRVSRGNRRCDHSITLDELRNHAYPAGVLTAVIGRLEKMVTERSENENSDENL